MTSFDSVPGCGLPGEGSVTLHEVTLQLRAILRQPRSRGSGQHISMCATASKAIERTLAFSLVKGRITGWFGVEWNSFTLCEDHSGCCFENTMKGQRHQLGGRGSCPGGRGGASSREWALEVVRSGRFYVWKLEPADLPTILRSHGWLWISVWSQLLDVKLVISLEMVCKSSFGEQEEHRIRTKMEPRGWPTLRSEVCVSDFFSEVLPLTHKLY